MLPLLLAAALAASPAYYHPDDVAAASKLFARASEEEGRRYEQLSAALSAASPPLIALDRNAALLGQRAPEGFQDYVLRLRTRAARQRLEAQDFVDRLGDDFHRAFEAALQRALPEVAGDRDPSEIRVCHPHRVLGPGMRVQRCEGEDLNAALAARMDADPELQQQVEALLARPWPSFELHGEPQPVLPIGDASGEELPWLDLARLSEALVGPRMDAIRAAQQQDWDEVDALEEQGRHEEALARGEELRAAYDRAMAALGAELLDALADAWPRLRRQGAPEAAGLCPNPPALGGCPGESLDERLLPLVLADRKLARRLAP